MNGLRVRAAVIAVLVLTWSSAPGETVREEAEVLARRVTSAYAGVRDYRMRVHSVVREGNAPPEETRVLYWFQRPDRIRMEFLRPHPGLVLVFPDRNGKVRLRLGGLLRFLRISLDPNSASLRVSPGQRVDQTDLGLLARNLVRSLAEGRPESLVLSQSAAHVVAELDAENHFQPGVTTRYRFWVDRERWLPVRVREEVPGRRWVREVAFEELVLNPGLPGSLFELE